MRGADAQGRAGSGLGLAIARGLAEAIDGELLAAGGSRLELRLRSWTDYPAAAGAGTPARLADGRGTNMAATTASSPTTTRGDEGGRAPPSVGSPSTPAALPVRMAVTAADPNAPPAVLMMVLMPVAMPTSDCGTAETMGSPSTRS